jgi:uncharacterized zinc-type alcohol dehydrogenase-like protein
MEFERRALRPNDVAIKITYAGICHSDLHTCRNDWGGTRYPVIPGHEIVGIVTATGDEVTRHRVGDTVAVGCMVDSCMECDQCLEGWEVFCRKGCVQTYNSKDYHDGTVSKGGYTDHIVVRDHFVCKVPDGMDAARVAPLLCAGITTYSPLRHWGAGPGKKVGIVGLGGLGHMGVKLAHAMGAHVVLFTTSAGKVADAKKLGADEVVISRDEEAMKPHAGSFHFILDTVAAPHNLDAYTSLLARDGTLCLVGAPELPHPSPAVFNLIFGRKSIAGSLIGGIAETQEMLDFCAAKKTPAEIEIIPVQKVNEAYERMLKGDVKYRFVIDMSSLK